MVGSRLLRVASSRNSREAMVRHQSDRDDAIVGCDTRGSRRDAPGGLRHVAGNGVLLMPVAVTSSIVQPEPVAQQKSDVECRERLGGPSGKRYVLIRHS